MKLAISTDTVTPKSEMSLDDIIKKNRSLKKKTGNNLKGVKKGAVTKRKPVNNQQNKRKPNTQNNRRPQNNNQRNTGFQKNNNQVRRNPGQQQFRQAAPAKASSGKLEISNLDYGVTDQDIRELFSEFGMLKNSAIHYGSNGVSLGTANVNFVNPASASAALKRYNGVRLDNRPMRITMSGGGVSLVQNRIQGNRLGQQGNNRRIGQVNNQGQKGQFKKQGQFKQGQSKNKPQGKGNKKPLQKKKPAQKKPELTAEQLNAQLDAYKAKV